MDYLKNYVVPFSGLKAGKHDFKFRAGTKFFECFENSNIEKGDIYVDVVLEKQASMMVFHFQLEGNIETLCDRCNSPLIVKEEGEFKQIVKFGSDEDSTTDEIIYLPESEVEINLAKPIYDFAHLLFPQKNVHNEGDCDQEMIKLLKKYSQKHDKEDIDPRWEALKKLN